MIKIDREKDGKASLEVKGSGAVLTAEICSGFKELVKFVASEDKLCAAAMFKTMAKCMADTAEILVDDFNIPIEALNDDVEDENDDLEKFKKKAEDEDILRAFLDSLTPKDTLKLLNIINKFEEFEEDD